MIKKEFAVVEHYVRQPLSQYIREAYVHKERKGHPQIVWKLQETVSIL